MKIQYLIYCAVLPIVSAAENNPEVELNKKAAILGLRWDHDLVKERHVNVSSRYHEPNEAGDFPVHIYRFVASAGSWALCGSGTSLGKHPGMILSAYHIFEKPAKYGAVKAGPRELSGKEKLLPVTGFALSDGDAIICVTDPKCADAPVVGVPKSDDVFREWEEGVSLVFHTWYRRIWLNTFPDQPIQALGFFEFRQGHFYLFFEWNVQDGESGAGAQLEGLEPDTYLIVSSRQYVPAELAAALSPEDRKRFKWKTDSMYGVGYIFSTRNKILRN